MVRPDDVAVDHVGGGVARDHGRERLQHGFEHAQQEPTGDTAGTRCSTCLIRPADDAIARPSAPSTSCLRNRAGCHRRGGSHGHALPEAAARLAINHHRNPRSDRPTPPPKYSLESTDRSRVKLWPHRLEQFSFAISIGKPSFPLVKEGVKKRQCGCSLISRIKDFACWRMS